MALSPQPAYQKLSTFEITFGNAGNTKTTIVKKMGKAVSEVSFPCRVCHEGTWSNFWIAVWKGKIYAGVGNEPGQKCLAFLTDNEDDHTENPAPANATTGTATTEQEDKKDGTTTRNGGEEKSQTEDKKRASDSVLYIGMGNSAQQRRPVKIRHLHVTPVPSFVAVLLENTNDSSTMDVLMENMEEIDDDALKEYQEQCRRAKARAEKFGIEYKEPDMAAVVPWSQARKLRANPQKGFITGIDITNPDELAKQEVRKARFGELAVTTSKKRNLEGDDKDDDEEVEGTPKTANTQTQEDETSEAITSPTSAWDNEQLVRPERKDPPPSLWPIPPPEDIEKEDNEFAMETDKPVLVPEKIHLFSIDWAAFKQIRTEDIMVGALSLSFWLVEKWPY